MSGPIAVYPGTFDPFTTGHLDIVRRAARVVDELVVGVARNAGKQPLFSLEERVALAQADISGLSDALSTKIRVVAFPTLLMDFAIAHGATFIVRGLRAVSDFEYEFQMAGMNARMNPDVETMFLMSSERQHFVSSRFVKEICALGGDVSEFVSPGVLAALRDKLALERPTAG